MTTPNQPSGPDGAYSIANPGSYQFGQNLNEATTKAIVTNGVVGSFQSAQNTHNTNVVTPLATATANANTAVTNASAAANAAAVAQSTAASASARASYWESEFVLASAGLVLGVNELLIGLCQNVPGGLTRTVTDMHVACQSQPNGLAFDLRKWDVTGTTSTTLGSYTMAANVTRANWANLGFGMASRERVYVYVTSVTGSVAPIVFQILLFGVMQ